MSLQEGALIGKYVVRRKLAEGGMAELYLCTVKGPEGFEKEVVIKRIRSFLAGDPGFVQMFIAEARLASRLNHANVVQIFDFDKHEDTYYLAMEYVRGHSLWEIRRRASELMIPMGPTLSAHLCAEVARGLHYAHRLSEKGRPLGLVHRDVTPQNVLVSFDGAVKLTDFGIAKAGDGLTAPGILKGKFAYMSPEQARGEAVDARSDVFSLGTVLWELLTGGRLFDADSEVAVLRAVQESVIAPPGRLNPDVPAPLDAIVMKALSRDLGERYQSAQELERALAQFVLSTARSVEETDVSAYLKKLFPDEHTAPGVTPAGQPEPAVAAKVEPAATRLLRPEPAPAQPSPVSPDEDPNAPTFITARSALKPDPEARPAGPTVGMRRATLIGASLFAVLAAAAGVVSLRAQRSRSQAEPGTPPPAVAAVSPQADGIEESPDAGSEALGGEAPEEPLEDEDGGDAVVEAHAEVAAPALEQTPPAEPSGRTRRRTGRGRPPAADQPKGFVVVQAKPWAHLYIDGRRVRSVEGQPAAEIDSRRRIALSPGAHVIVLQHPAGRRECAVTIEPGREVSCEFTLQDAAGR